jgi:cytochrome c-type biogenesis protein CcmF
MALMPLITWMLAMLVIITSVRSLYSAHSARKRWSLLSMSCAHIGIALMAIGAAMNAVHSVETSAKMAINSEVVLGPFTVRYTEHQLSVGPNYSAERTILVVNGIDRVLPERRHYQVRVMNMTEPGIKSYWHGDLYITLGEKLADGSFAVRLQYKAYIGWVWFGGLLVVLGGLIGFLSKRRFYSRSSLSAPIS